MLSGDFSTRIRNGIGFDGLISFIFGLLILIWPSKSAVVFTAMVAAAFILIGIFYLILTFSRNVENNWTRASFLILAAIYLIAGIFMFINDLASSAQTLFIFVSIFVGITWLIEGILGIGMISRSPSKGWTIFASIISILAGISLMISPLQGAEILWLLLGINLMIVGVFKIAHYFALRRQ